MMRYLKIFYLYWKMRILQNLEYRFNYFIGVFIDLFWASITLISVDWIFGQVNLIAGWSKNEALLLACINMVFASLIWYFIIPSMDFLAESIHKGNLDFYLIRPINTRFLVSVSKFSSDQFIRIIVLGLLIFHFLNLLQITPSLLQWLGFLVLFVIGLLIFYGIFFLITTTTIWLINLSNIQFIFQVIVDAGAYPVDIFRNTLKLVFYYLIPLGFLATFPTQVLLGKGDWKLIGVGLLATLVILGISQWFWNFALKHYSSASS